LKLW
jgi:hypothetical protein